MCRYFKNGTSESPMPLVSYLPSSQPSLPVYCGVIGYEPTRPMGMPPCKWIANAYNQDLFAARIAAGLEMLTERATTVQWRKRERDDSSYVVKAY